MWAYRVGMVLRRFSFSRNPLRRRSDRIESGMLAGAVALLLLAVPIATQANEASYKSGLLTAAQGAATSAQTVATLQENAPLRERTSLRGPGKKPQVRAVWQAPDGARRTGTLEVGFGTPAGTRIPVWTDHDGTIVKAPITLLTVQSRAVVVATVVVLGWVLLLAIAFAVFRKVLDHYRFIAWEAEWEEVERKWRRPTR